MEEKRKGTQEKRTQGGNRKKRPEGFVTDLDQYLFGQGTHYDIFRKLGAHPAEYQGKTGVYFAVWAPHAREVRLISEFNGWNEESHPMERLEPLGIWELFVPGVKPGVLYKYLIETQDHRKLYKADPFAASAEMRPGTASRVADISGFKWSDAAWMEQRQQKKMTEEPMSIYEVHPGSWKKHPHGPDEDGFSERRRADGRRQGADFSGCLNFGYLPDGFG